MSCYRESNMMAKKPEYHAQYESEVMDETLEIIIDVDNEVHKILVDIQKAEKVAEKGSCLKGYLMGLVIPYETAANYDLFIGMKLISDEDDVKHIMASIKTCDFKLKRKTTKNNSNN